MKGQRSEVDASQFFFSTAEIAAEAHRQDLRKEVKKATRVEPQNAGSPLRHTA